MFIVVTGSSIHDDVELLDDEHSLGCFGRTSGEIRRVDR